MIEPKASRVPTAAALPGPQPRARSRRTTGRTATDATPATTTEAVTVPIRKATPTTTNPSPTMARTRQLIAPSETSQNGTSCWPAGWAAGGWSIGIIVVER